jgi:ribosomal protein S27AE
MPASLRVQSSSFDETFEPKPQPCTKCGAPVILARIERAKPGFDLRTLECTKCNNVDQYIVEHGTAAPWALRVRAAG